MSPAVRIGALIILASCAPAAGPPAGGLPSPGPAIVSYGPSLITGTGEDSCDGRRYAGLVGQDQTALERVLIMRPIRIIRPGDAVTEDFSAQRINFVIDGLGRIADIGCF